MASSQRNGVRSLDTQAHTCACKHMYSQRQANGVGTCRDPHTLITRCCHACLVCTEPCQAGNGPPPDPDSCIAQPVNLGPPQGFFHAVATVVCKWARESPAIGLPSLLGLWGTAAPVMFRVGTASPAQRGKPEWDQRGGAEPGRGLEEKTQRSDRKHFQEEKLWEMTHAGWGREVWMG